MKFKVGQKVVCVKSFEDLRSIWGFNYPRINDVVEVLSITQHHAVPNEYLINVSGLECDVCASCFRPLQYDIIPNSHFIEDIVIERQDIVLPYIFIWAELINENVK